MSGPDPALERIRERITGTRIHTALEAERIVADAADARQEAIDSTTST